MKNFILASQGFHRHTNHVNKDDQTQNKHSLIAPKIKRKNTYNFFGNPSVHLNRLF